MSPTSKKIVGGALALLFVVTFVQSKAIAKIAKSVNSKENVSASISQKVALDTDYQMTGIAEESQAAQVFGSRGGGCGQAPEISIMSIPTYSLPDGTDNAIVFKFRAKNNNTQSGCAINLTRFEFEDLTLTNANRNFEKIYLLDAATNVQINTNNGVAAFIERLNRTQILLVPDVPVIVQPGQYADFAVSIDYLRNTNIGEEPGYPAAPEDYFMVGISQVYADINGTPVNSTFIPVRFDKKPIMVD